MLLLMSASPLSLELVDQPIDPTHFGESSDESEDDEEDEDEEDEDEDEDEDEKDEDDDDHWHEEEHEHEIEVSSEKVKIKTESLNQSVEIELEVEMRLDESSIEIEFEEESGRSESEQSLEVQFHRLFEYVDSNGDGLWQQSESIEREWHLHGDVDSNTEDEGVIDWQPPQLTEVTLGGSAGTEIHLVGHLSNSSEQFQIRFWVMNSPMQLLDETISPTEFKMDFIIENWAFSNASHRLGLEMDVEFDHEVEIEDGKIHSFQELNHTNLSLAFSWVDFVEIDRQNQSVSSQSIAQAGANEQRVLLSYPAGQQIVHDPMIGARYVEVQLAGGNDSNAGGGGIDNPTSDPSLLALLPYVGLVLALIALIAVVVVPMQRSAAIEVLESEHILPWLLPPPAVEIQVYEEDRL